MSKFSLKKNSCLIRACYVAVLLISLCLCLASCGKKEEKRKKQPGWKISKTMRYSSDGKLLGTDEYEYDSDGYRIGGTVDVGIGHGSKCQYQYDSNGNLVREDCTKGSTEKEYEYDKAGKLLKMSVKTQYGKQVVAYDYNNEGLLSQSTEISQSADGQVLFAIRLTNEYENGKLTRQTQSDGRSVEELEYSCEYAFEYEGDTLLRKTQYKQMENGDLGVLDRYEYAYDENGNMIKETLYHGYMNTPASWTEYEYILIS